MTPTQRKAADDLLYDNMSPEDRRQSKMVDGARDGIDTHSHIGIFKSVIQIDNRTALQAHTESAEKAWSVTPDNAAANYFKMLRQSELQGGQFVSNSMTRASVGRHDRQPAIENSDARANNNCGNRRMRDDQEGAQSDHKQDARRDNYNGRQSQDADDARRAEAEARFELLEKIQTMLNTFPRLATVQTHPGLKTQGWTQQYTVGVDELAHPEDWARFVAGDESMPLSKVRGSKTMFSIPPFRGYVQDWNNDDELQEGILIHVPRDDNTCVRIGGTTRKMH